jgi:sn-glycerol 3-phosphate transport system substrate-binding protein
MSRSPARPRRSAHRLLALLAALLLAATSAACVRDEGNGRATAGGGDGDGEGSGPTLPDCPLDALEDADGPVEIDLWHGLGAQPQVALNDLADEFNSSQDQVRVRILNQGTSYDEVFRKYVAAIPSGQLPAIAYLEDTTLRQLVDSGTVLPAEACEEADDFSSGQLPVVRNYYSSEGIYWPGYTNVSSQVLYYNANHLRRAGLDPEAAPQTLEELRTTAEALKESGVDRPLALILNAWHPESWITGAGETVVNEENGRDGLADESTFDNPATHELYEWIDGMVEDGLLQGYSATAGQINHYLAVAQQRSSMLIESVAAATTVKAIVGGEDVEGAPEGIDPDDVDLSKIDVQAAPFPGLEEPSQVRVAGGAFFMTNTGSPEQQAAAWEFMKFMWKPESQVHWHLLGSYLPTTQAAASNPEVVAFWEDDLAGRILKVGYDQLVAVDPENPGPQIGPYTDYSDAIKDSLDRLVLEGQDPDDVIARADGTIQDALSRYIEDNE